MVAARTPRSFQFETKLTHKIFTALSKSGRLASMTRLWLKAVLTTQNRAPCLTHLSQVSRRGESTGGSFQDDSNHRHHTDQNNATGDNTQRIDPDPQLPTASAVDCIEQMIHDAHPTDTRAVRF